MTSISDNSYISEAIDSLVSFVGIKESVSITSYAGLKPDECVRRVATDMYLPVQLDVRYVLPSEFSRVTASHDYQSLDSSLSSQGIFNTTAQVLIPPNLPMYGSSELRNFKIQIKINKDLVKQIETFVAVVAHEFSHIILHSVQRSEKDSEFYTDLIPLIMGYGSIVSRGRIVNRTSCGSNSTVTTTYGYLNQEQFSFAKKYVRKKIKPYISQKKALLCRLSRERKYTNSVSEKMERFYQLRQLLDRCPPHRVPQEDALKIAKIHQPEYGGNWRPCLDKVLAAVENDPEFLTQTHYTKKTVEQMEGFSLLLDSMRSQISSLADEVSTACELMWRYLPANQKLRFRFESFRSR